MNYDWIEEYCTSKKGVEKDDKVEWKATRYMIAGKMFAMDGGDKEGAHIFTVKLDPGFSDFLRQEYDCVVPGYYMNKMHWSSMYFDGNVPDDIVKDMIDQAYEIVLGSLPKKKQKEIIYEL